MVVIAVGTYATSSVRLEAKILEVEMLVGGLGCEANEARGFARGCWKLAKPEKLEIRWETRPESSWAIMVNFRSALGHLGVILVHFGAILADLEAILDHLPFWPISGPFWSHLEAS